MDLPPDLVGDNAIGPGGPDDHRPDDHRPDDRQPDKRDRAAYCGGKAAEHHRQFFWRDPGWPRYIPINISERPTDATWAGPPPVGLACQCPGGFQIEIERDSMRISARNRLEGKIVGVQKGATTAHVRIDIGNGVAVTSSITNEAVDALGLTVGGDADAPRLPARRRPATKGARAGGAERGGVL